MTTDNISSSHQTHVHARTLQLPWVMYVYTHFIDIPTHPDTIFTSKTLSLVA